MSDNAQDRAEQIFFEAIELPPRDRAGYVDRQCGEDSQLRGLVQALLDADEAAGDAQFLESHFLGGASLAANLQPSKEAPADPDSQQQDSRFRILSRYEQGGLGEVLIAHDRQLNREVAVKQIRPKWQGNNEAKERFIQEAEVTGRLEHPGIVPVYAMGTWDDGRPFYAMRFIQGMTLKQVISLHRESTADPDSPSNSMELRGLLNRFVDVCNTIEYAHSRQILHRDIKPSNIMIGPYGETLVVDWGLAKLLDAPYEESVTAGVIAQKLDESGSSRTQVGGTVGTPQYMSPEQAAGNLESIGVRTDVYLLGATLYQILTGVPPHEEESVSKLIERVKGGILTSPRELDPDVPAPLEAICLKAMATDAADRYRSAAALSADIERWLADQPVSVFRDPLPVRLGRLLRQHRTLAMSGAVAAVLLTVGSVVGSMFWSYQRSRQFKVEQERNLKEAQLIASRQQRVNELQESATDALELSQREIRANRFSAALNILHNSSEAIAEESELASLRDQIDARSRRIERIVEFYRQAEMSEQYNAISRDTQGIMASTASLKSLGVWDKTDWWASLPADDLTPQQRDELRWDVYQQWLMLDGMLIKTVGTRLFGTANASRTARLLSAIRRLGTDAGKREAAAALVVSDRIDLFRQSEAARWYRSVARNRLDNSRRLKGEEIGTPRNAADAQKLGVLCLLSAVDPSFAVVFRDYMGKDAITAGRDLFQVSASLRPEHYWTQMGLGQMQYFIAEQESGRTWESYQPAVQTMGRCIAINPESCFGFADRSSLFRFQWEQLQEDTTEPEEIRNQRAAELLQWSLQDAQTAYRLSSDQSWVGWTYGMALSVAGQTEEAVDVFFEASKRTFPLMELGDANLVRADDIRGRSEAAEYATKLIEQHPDHALYRVLLASIRLNQENYEASQEQIELALRQPIAFGHAYAVRGMIRLHHEDMEGAADDFRLAKESDPDHLWAWYGAAVCEDARGQHDAAIEAFEQALRLATTDEHRAACWLGISRSAAFLGRFEQATQSVASAQELQPACDIGSIGRPLLERFKQLRAESAEEATLIPLRDFLQFVGELHRTTRIAFEEAPSGESFDAPLLNGDFELDPFRYWSDDLGVTWRNDPGYRSTATISSSESHGGTHAMHLVGDAGGDGGQQGSTGQGSTGQGSTGQGFPIPAHSRCRLSVWSKASGLEPGAIRLFIGDRAVGDRAASAARATLELDGGTYDWRKFEVEFEVGDAPDPTLTVVPLKLKIVCSGAGEAYLDDIQVAVTRQ